MRTIFFGVLTSFALAWFSVGQPALAAGGGPEAEADPFAEPNENAPAEAEPFADALAEDPGIELNLVPSNFNLNRSISFDDQGEPRHRNNQLSINFRCFYETDTKPLSYRDIEITSVITSAGEELEVDPNRQNRHQQQIHANRQRNGKPYFDIYVNLPAPSRHADEITELRGKLKMELSQGPERVLRFSPLSDYVDKKFRVTDMDDSPMSISLIEAHNNQPAMIEWRYARSIEPLIQEIKFYRRNGVEFEANRHGGNSDNTSRSQRFSVGPADDVIMVVRLFRQTRTVEVPFVVRDMPLPVAEPRGPRFDLAIATEPLGGAVGLEPVDGEVPVGPGAPGENDLPIIILE
ncbi:hypothetical protein [Algisphaera agarilytica]|uniref:Uncharacterized protein n=1 Tax=Algisphaera agarilytica TaxID=1385975 RepID=A0A7X0HBG9_9BACT|nr:hypothetical protein [Algisphaera agarilytica]MBB6431661.1 hypothetical protein [Algisphaera agarilytica]